MDHVDPPTRNTDSWIMTIQKLKVSKVGYSDVRNTSRSKMIVNTMNSTITRETDNQRKFEMTIHFYDIYILTLLAIEASISVPEKQMWKGYCLSNALLKHRCLHHSHQIIVVFPSSLITLRMRTTLK